MRDYFKEINKLTESIDLKDIKNLIEWEIEYNNWKISSDPTISTSINTQIERLEKIYWVLTDSSFEDNEKKEFLFFAYLVTYKSRWKLRIKDIQRINNYLINAEI